MITKWGQLLKCIVEWQDTQEIETQDEGLCCLACLGQLSGSLHILLGHQDVQYAHISIFSCQSVCDVKPNVTSHREGLNLKMRFSSLTSLWFTVDLLFSGHYIQYIYNHTVQCLCFWLWHFVNCVPVILSTCSRMCLCVFWKATHVVPLALNSAAAS